MSGELKNTFKHQLYEAGKSLYEWVSKPITASKFEKGMLTPEEFVRAGDSLVTKCPSWTWVGAPEKTRVAYLPKGKQYLVIRRVPCLIRARLPASLMKEEVMNLDGDEWTLPVTLVNPKAACVDVVDMADEQKAAAAPEPIGHLDDMDDMDDLSAPPAQAAAAADVDSIEAPPLPEDAAVSSEPDYFAPRMYDISITYDQSYATPRMWLFGYDSSGKPLTETETCEDISGDYTGETVTLLPHPFLETPHVSIHPCKHAESMERMLQSLNELIADPHQPADAAGSGEVEVVAAPTGERLTVDEYIFVFLKFMTCIIPTIQYDNTRDLDFGKKRTEQ